MELSVSSPKRGLLPPDCDSDPEEKEISDDDRNHKHRRRDTRSQSSERDALEQVSIRPFKKRNRPFENGHPYREANPQPSEMWKNYNISSLDKDHFAKFGKRRHSLAPFSRAPLDLNQRIRANQRESGSWSQRDPKFGLADISSQMAQQGPVPSSLFAGRGMQNISNTQSISWSTFGLVPGIPNNGMDTISLGLQVRPPMNPSLNIGITRQRCRDFEEQGFCLRGDMCPMEHGINRIVVEDVQSLSQFNLPVSLPSAHLMGAPGGPVPTGPSSIMTNSSKGLHSKISKPGVGDNGPGLNGAFVGSAVTTESDLYDPDQPLWTNDCSEALNASKDNVTESLLGAGPTDDHVGFFDGSDFEGHFRGTGIASGSQSKRLSPWGRIGSSRNTTETREKPNPLLRSSNYIENDMKEERIDVDEIGSQVTDSSPRTQSNTSRMMRKPTQKAQRTLFVRGIPQENNKKEALLFHFKKFGEVIDIYIPLNSDRAFVQFSKREEAEAALRAPDAIMGNRFIKLWWANRDNIPDDGTCSGNSVPLTIHGSTVNAVASYPSIGDRGKDNVRSVSPGGSIVHSSVASVPSLDHPKPSVTKGPKAPPASQKKVENLVSLKEEIRKKQEMLDQKRNEFRRKLDKLEKQATGLKGEVTSDQASKAQKVGTVAADVAKAENSSTATSPVSTVVVLPADNSKAAENFVANGSQTNAIVEEDATLKQSIRPLVPLVGAPFVMNRFKLDNRPTSFKIIPLPTGLANVSVLKEHFSTFGDLSSVDLEDLESNDAGDESAMSKTSAHISFRRRRSAEMAFLNGKCLKGHDLQFMWLASSNNSSKDIGVKENPSSSSKGSSDTDNVRPAVEFASTVSPKDSISGESENLEKRDGVGAECMEWDEDLQSSSMAISSEKVTLI
ncbi:hypothetical protein LguiB_019807 [Lonicera macranthoides]